MFEVEGETGDIGSPEQQGREEEGEGNRKPCYQTGEESSHGHWALWPLFPSGRISDIFRLVCTRQGLPTV